MKHRHDPETGPCDCAGAHCRVCRQGPLAFNSDTICIDCAPKTTAERREHEADRRFIDHSLRSRSGMSRGRLRSPSIDDVTAADAVADYAELTEGRSHD